MAAKSWHGDPPPGVDADQLRGALLVVEGPDGTGVSTHMELLAEWLEQRGYPVARTGLIRSKLVSAELDRARLGNVLSPRTMSLFYATDFYDQLENVIVPALRAGSVVLADRYIYTLMARDRVRGAEPAWLESLYSMAPIPDAVLYLDASVAAQTERTLTARHRLDYWDSGMDLGLARDWFTSFQRYQALLRAEYDALDERYGFQRFGADGGIEDVQTRLRDAVDRVLATSYEPSAASPPPAPAVRRIHAPWTAG
jgi:dTMP kinase